MNKNSVFQKLAILSISFFMFTVFIPHLAEAKTFMIKNGETKGSSITSLFNFGHHTKTTLSTFSGKDSLGEVNGQFVADYDTGQDDTTNCPGEYNYEFKIYKANGVLSYKKGQLFLDAVDTGIGCLQIIPDNFAEVSLTVTYDIIGGSGQYAGAEGTIVSTSTGLLLWNSLGPDNQFGSFISTYEGTFETNGE